jgi:hypothetical protein
MRCLWHNFVVVYTAVKFDWCNVLERILGIRSANYQLLWPKGGHSELWRVRLICGSFSSYSMAFFSSSVPSVIVLGEWVVGCVCELRLELGGDGPNCVYVLCGKIMFALYEDLFVFLNFQKVLFVTPPLWSDAASGSLGALPCLDKLMWLYPTIK